MIRSFLERKSVTWLLVRLAIAVVLTIALASTTIGLDLPGGSNASSPALNPGEGLTAGQRITSGNGKFSLVMQKDGNLVEYGPQGPIWDSLTFSYPGSYLAMQPDGNLVVYAQNHAALWNSRTYGQPGAYLTMQNDGNLVLYSASNTPLWWTWNRMSDRLLPGQSLQSSWIRSSDGRYYLFMQGDGNLVLYTNERVPIWSSNTQGHPGAYVEMQPDGNLVVYTMYGRPLWDSGTFGHAGAVAVLQTSAAVLVCGKSRARMLWSSGTAQGSCTSDT